MEKLKKYKRIVAAAVIAAATVIIELLFNYHALVDGYEPIDISDHIVLTQLENGPGYLISYDSEAGVYVGQIKLVGDYSSDCVYQINTSEINGFDKRKENTYTDTTTAWFSDYYTDINAKVKSLEISIPQKSVEDQIEAAYLLNSFEINKYRILFIIIVLILLYCTIFERIFARKPELFFAVFATIFGLLIILYVQPTFMGWDEQIHFNNVYSAACGKSINWTAAARAIVDKTVPQCNTKAEFAQMRQIMNEMGQQVLYMEQKDSGILPYSYASYVPMILFLKLGMMLRLPFTWLYMLGKLGNLIMYVLIVSWAIRLARKQKLLLTFVSIMPTTVFLASTYSYDAFVIACIELGCVLWCNEVLYPQDSPQDFSHKLSVIAIVLLLTLGCFSKAVYSPLVLLVLIIPWICKGKAKMRKIIWIMVFAIAALTMMTFVLPFFTNVAARNVAFGGDSRGGDTSAVRQAISMIKHPIESIRLMLASIFRWNSFKVDSPATEVNYYIGHAMLLRFGGWKNLPANWNLLLFPVSTLLFLYQGDIQKETDGFKTWQRLYGLMILFITVALIWLALYLSFSEVGEVEIIGVQPRYFIPLIYLGAILFQSDKITLKVSEDRISRIMMVSVNIIWMFMIYGALLNSRLL